MSTRAIIALPVKGGYKTAWCWNDGGPSDLGTELRKYFKLPGYVKELIQKHSFSSIGGNKYKKELLNLFFDQITETNFKQLGNGRYVLQHNYDGKVVCGGKDGFFKTIEEMLAQDLNYVYVFENYRWKVYR